MKQKLVRDRSKELYPDDTYRLAEGEDYYTMLVKKLDEEVEELKASDSTDPLEYADVLTVLSALADHKKISHDHIAKVTEEKLLSNGGFRKGIVWIQEE